MLFRKKTEDTKSVTVHIKGKGVLGEIIEFQVKTTFPEAYKLMSTLMGNGLSKASPPVKKVEKVVKKNGVAFPSQTKEKEKGGDKGSLFSNQS